MSDNAHILKELNLFCSSNSILVLNQHGKLYRLSCPFKVKARLQVHILQEGQVYFVTAVKLTPELVMIYFIGNTAYLYSNFYILL